MAGPDDADFAEVLLKAVSDEESRPRQMALVSLGRMGHASAAAAVVRHFERGLAADRAYAALGLGLLGRRRPDPGVRDFLARHLETAKDAEERAALSLACGLARADAARPAVVRIAASGSPEVAAQARFALGLLDTPADQRAALYMAVEEGREFLVGREASLALGLLEDPTVVGRLESVARSPRLPDARRAAALVELGRIGDEREVDLYLHVLRERGSRAASSPVPATASGSSSTATRARGSAGSRPTPSGAPRPEGRCRSRSRTCRCSRTDGARRAQERAGKLVARPVATRSRTRSPGALPRPAGLPPSDLHVPVARRNPEPRPVPLRQPVRVGEERGPVEAGDRARRIRERAEEVVVVEGREDARAKGFGEALEVAGRPLPRGEAREEHVRRLLACERPVVEAGAPLHEDRAPAHLDAPREDRAPGVSEGRPGEPAARHLDPVDPADVRDPSVPRRDGLHRERSDLESRRVSGEDEGRRRRPEPEEELARRGAPVDGRARRRLEYGAEVHRVVVVRVADEYGVEVREPLADEVIPGARTPEERRDQAGPRDEGVERDPVHPDREHDPRDARPAERPADRRRRGPRERSSLARERRGARGRPVGRGPRRGERGACEAHQASGAAGGPPFSDSRIRSASSTYASAVRLGPGAPIDARYCALTRRLRNDV